jgi:hypothetical protein
MRLTRATVVVASVAALAVAVPASAKPKVACNLAVDATKDTFLIRAQETPAVFGPQEDGFDLTSVDIASNAKTITGVLRVVKLSKAIQSAPEGIDFRVNFTLPNQDGAADNFFLNARLDADGTTHFFAAHITRLAPNASTTIKLADGTGVFDTKKNEVRISAPLSSIKNGGLALRNGMKIFLSGLDQSASRVVVVNPSTGIATATFADVAQSDKTYVAGSRSCVTPGK